MLGVTSALAQSPDFARKPPAWQVTLAASKDPSAGAAITTKGKGAAVAVPVVTARTAYPPSERRFRDSPACQSSTLLSSSSIIATARGRIPLWPPLPKPSPTRTSPRSPGTTPRCKCRAESSTASRPATSLAARAIRGQRARTPGMRRLPRRQHHRRRPDPAAGSRNPPRTPQLNSTHFARGERKNDGDGIMQSIAKRLSDADIKALSEYYGTMR